ncbi:YsnF/AvaK domain-containing protein [Deinococcus sp. UYEF24]
MDQQVEEQGEPLKTMTSGLTPHGMLELREEVLEVTKEQIQTRQVSFRREVKVRTETVTTELRRETLIIEVGPGQGEVFFNGEQLRAGESREVVLYEEQVVLNKVPYVTEEVRIGKQVVTETHQQQVELQYEVLVTEHSDGLHSVLASERP